MSKRPKLIYRELDYPNFNQAWIRPLVEQHFEMVAWQPMQSYSKDCLVLTYYTQDFDAAAWFRPLEANGHCVIVDHLFDSDTATPSRRIHDRKLQLRNPHWMWYRTALLAADAGYNHYQPNRHYSHDFLCLMNKIRDHRDRVQNELSQCLTHARWSYVDRGIDIGDSNERQTKVFWEYYMNPQWYDSTCWHLVVESWVRTDAWTANPSFPNYRTEISEKSYKPLAYFQPFVVLGSVDTLKFLKTQGFETFDNLWSEHYDTIESDAARVDWVLDHVRDLVTVYNRHWPGWDRHTQDKLQHNHARFFDLATVKRRFDTEIIGDIMEFIAQ